MPRKSSTPSNSIPVNPNPTGNKPRIKILGVMQDDEGNRATVTDQGIEFERRKKYLEDMVEELEEGGVQVEEATMEVIQNVSKFIQPDPLPDPDAQPKRGRGRPKGSTKKNVIPIYVQTQTEPVAEIDLDEEIEEEEIDEEELAEMEREVAALERMKDLDYGDDPVDDDEDDEEIEEEEYLEDLILEEPIQEPTEGMDVEVAVQELRKINEQISGDCQRIWELAIQSRDIVDKWGDDYQELADEFNKLAETFSQMANK